MLILFALALQGQIPDTTRDVILTPKHAYIMLAPDVVCGPIVRQITWSPDGRLLLVQRDTDGLTAEMVEKLFLGSEAPPAKVQSQIYIWNRRARTGKMVFAEDTSQVQVSMVRWMGNSGTAFVSGWTRGENGEFQKRAFWFVRSSGSTRLNLPGEEEYMEFLSAGSDVSETRDGVERDYMPDTLGSTAALLDEKQNMTDTWEYYPYGEVAARTGTHETDLTFVGMLGYFRDIIDKLLYVRARILRVDLARWLTVDPLWPSVSAYSYAEGEPTVEVDPSGLAPRACHRRMGDCFRQCAPKLPVLCLEEKIGGKWVMVACTCGNIPPRLIGNVIKGIIRRLPGVTAAAIGMCAGFFIDCVSSIYNGDNLVEAVCTCWNAYADTIEEAGRVQRTCFNFACGPLMDGLDALFGCGDKKWRST